MDQDELKKILRLHKLWLEEKPEGKRADLSEANLRGVNLSWADLRNANFSWADLTGANLFGANFSGADFCKAKLRGANLEEASLMGTNFSWANLFGANLREADLREANLDGADLREADLRGAYLYGADLRGAYLWGADLEGAKPDNLPQNEPLIGYKKVRDSKGNKYLVTLEIPAEAARSRAVTNKCRAEFVKVTKIERYPYTEEGLFVMKPVVQVTGGYDKKTVYRVGRITRPDKWNPNRWAECSHGIHFFQTKEEAENY